MSESELDKMSIDFDGEKFTVSQVKELFNKASVNVQMQVIEMLKQDEEAMSYEAYQNLVKWFEDVVDKKVQVELDDVLKNEKF